MREALTGTRIRDRRVMAGTKQSALARQIGISASYLNLIEHNRRKIGGKLLLDIAGALGVEPAALTTGAEAAMIATLREAGSGATMAEGELDRAEDFVGRFPGWADALALTHRKLAGLEHTVEVLSDRLAHDPEVAASVHEVLSTAAAIRSTASILAGDKDLPAEWRERFHANIDADSRRLADSSKTLVGFLDPETGEAAQTGTPQEDVEAFLQAHNYGFETLETPDADIAGLVADAPELTSQAARRIAKSVLEQMRADGAHLSLKQLRAGLSEAGLDPPALAARFQVSVACILRRLACIPDLGYGLVVADQAGSFLFRKSAEGFTLPRFGAGCPLWPLFQAFRVPEQVLCQRVQMPTRTEGAFDCFAATEAISAARLNTPPLLHATMLIVPVPAPDVPMGPPPVDVGPACRICPAAQCQSRREPSILSEGF
ncbi:MAG: short-chain fatty acyl-CoA regulator family protein [Pseudomonadota bacterium]